MGRGMEFDETATKAGIYYDSGIAIHLQSILPLPFLLCAWRWIMSLTRLLVWG